MPVTVDANTCIGCGACIGVCPTQSLEFDENGHAKCNEETCIDCHACIATCPVGAISEK